MQVEHKNTPCGHSSYRGEGALSHGKSCLNKDTPGEGQQGFTKFLHPESSGWTRCQAASGETGGECHYPKAHTGGEGGGGEPRESIAPQFLLRRGQHNRLSQPSSCTHSDMISLQSSSPLLLPAAATGAPCPSHNQLYFQATQK